MPFMSIDDVFFGCILSMPDVIFIPGSYPINMSYLIYSAVTKHDMAMGNTVPINKHLIM